MSSITAASPSSIEQTNAAYLARLRGPAASRSATAVETKSLTGFAGEMAAVSRDETAQPTSLTARAASTQTASAPKNETEEQLAIGASTEEEADFGFDDFVDLINPLHHIPIVGTIYRELTGDKIEPEIQVLGGIGFGLATGSVLLSTASAIASAIFEQESGQEPTVQIAQALFGGEETVQVAEADIAEVEEIAVADAGTAAAVTQDAQEEGLEQTLMAAAQADEALPDEASAMATVATAAAPVASSRAAPAFARFATTRSDEIRPLLATAQSGGMRVGNVLYAAPEVRSAARVSSVPSSNLASSASNVTTVQQAAQDKATQAASAAQGALAEGGEGLDETASLGALLHAQAKAQMAGQSLPPELIQDMMMKAYGKYSSVHPADVGG